MNENLFFLKNRVDFFSILFDFFTPPFPTDRQHARRAEIVRGSSTMFGSPAPSTPSGFGGGFGNSAAGGFGTPAATGGGGLFRSAASPAPAASGGFGGFGASPAPAQSSGGFGFGGASSPAPGGSLFGGGGQSTPGFGASAPAGGSLFGGSTAGTAGGFGFGGASAAPTSFGGTSFGGAAAPSTGGGFGSGVGLFGGGGASSNPATGGVGGLFGASAPAYGAAAPSAGGSLFGGAGASFSLATPAPGAPGGSLFAPPASTTAGSFGVGASSPFTSGSIFGGGPAPVQQQHHLALAPRQPQPSALATVDGQPVKHFTQWGELAPHSQQYLQAIERQIVRFREDSKLLDGISRLRGDGSPSRTAGSQVGGRQLEGAARSAGVALKLLETQLWSDGERLEGLREVVVATLRDVEHARARLTRLKEAEEAERLASSLARSGQHPPDASTAYVPPPRRPSAFLKGAVDRLYAAAEGFERGTLEMERNLRTTGRVHGHGGAGPGLEALAAALRGAAAQRGGAGASLLGTDGLDPEDSDAAARRSASERFASASGDRLGPGARYGSSELRGAVDGAQRYFNKVGGDLARLHEKVRLAKREHLAALRSRGDRRDPFAEAEHAEAEYARLSAAAERPGFASAPPPGLPGGGPSPLSSPAPGSSTPLNAGAATPWNFGGAPTGDAARSPGSTSLFGFAGAAGAPASTPAMGGGGPFGTNASSAAAAGGGLFTSPAPAHSSGGFGFGGAGASSFGSPAPVGSSPAANGGFFGGGAASFGSPAPVSGGGLFGSPAPAGGSLFGAPGTPGGFGAPATQQPRRARRR